MRYDIKVYDNEFREKETIRDVSEAQLVSICQTIIRLGGRIKVKEILPNKACAGRATTPAPADESETFDVLAHYRASHPARQ